MRTLTFKKQFNNPQLRQAYLNLQPDSDGNVDLTTMQSHFAAMYAAVSDALEAKYLQYYMTVLHNFALATAHAQQDVPKKEKKSAPAGRLLQWVLNTIVRKKNVPPSKVRPPPVPAEPTSLAAQPPPPNAKNTNVSSSPRNSRCRVMRKSPSAAESLFPGPSLRFPRRYGRHSTRTGASSPSVQ